MKTLIIFVITLTLFGCTQSIRKFSPIEIQDNKKDSLEYMSGYEPDANDGLYAYNNGDYSGALKVMLPLTKKNDSVAEWVMGEMYFFGYGVEKDSEKSLKFYRLAAYHGNVAAILKLGFMYENGQVKVQDDPYASNWYTPHDSTLDTLTITELIALGNDGNKEAQFLVGRAYQYGDAGVKADTHLASVWFEKSNQSGYWQAKTILSTSKTDEEKKASKKYYEYIKQNNKTNFENAQKKITPYIYGQPIYGTKDDSGGYDPSSSNNINETSNKNKSLSADLTSAKKQCSELGYMPKTEKFGICVLELSK